MSSNTVNIQIFGRVLFSDGGQTSENKTRPKIQMFKFRAIFIFGRRSTSENKTSENKYGPKYLLSENKYVYSNFLSSAHIIIILVAIIVFSLSPICCDRCSSYKTRHTVSSFRYHKCLPSNGERMDGRRCFKLVGCIYEHA